MSANGKKIAAAALSGLMAMGTLPVAALAETAVETQASVDDTNVVKNGTVSLRFQNVDYTKKDGEDIELAAGSYDSSDQVVTLKSVGSYTFKQASFSDTGYSTYKLYNDQGNYIGTANAYVSDSAIVIEYYLYGSPTVSVSTTINLKVTDNDTTGLYFQRVDAQGKKLNGLGRVTYNGGQQTMALFDGDVAATGWTVTGVASQPTAGQATNSGSTVTVQDAGTYVFNVANGSQTGTVTVVVDQLDLNKASVEARDKKTSSDPTLSDIVINGVIGTDYGSISGLTIARAEGYSPSAGTQKYTISVASSNKNVKASSKDFTYRQENGGWHGVNYKGTNYGNQATGAAFLLPAESYDLDKNQSFDASQITAAATGDTIEVTYVNLDTLATTTTAPTTTGHFMAIAQVKETSDHFAGKIFIPFTNYRAGSYDTLVSFGGKNIQAGTVGRTEYTGSSLKPTVTVSGPNGTLKEGTDYKVTLYQVDASGKNQREVSDIVDAGYYKVVITGLDGQPLTGVAQTTSLVVTPAYLTAQLSEDGQADGHFVYTGSVVTPKFEFFKQDASGSYAYYNGRIQLVSSLDQSAQATLTKDNRYSKVDLSSDAYSVDYWSGETSVDASDLIDKGTYTYDVRDAKADNYTFTTLNDVTFKISDARKNFEDVADTAWYAASVNEAADEGWVHGYGDGRLFGPEDDIKRGDVAVVLFNMASANGWNVNTDNYTSKTYGFETGFDDVDSSSYYAQAIAWAKDAGVVNGYGDGTFKPEQKVTREEFAAMLSNFASKLRNYEAGSDADLAKFPDANAVSDWARSSVAWATHNNVMGKGGVINPSANITRAEVAAMVVSVHNIVK